MNLSREGAIELLGWEAIVLTRYRDSVGVWTLAGGHTKAAGPPDPSTFTGTLTLQQAFDLFTKDVAKYVADVNAALTHQVNQGQFDALVSFHYNTGRIHSATVTQAINAADMHTAAACFGQYVRAGGKISDALVRRRAGERHLFETGEYVNGGHALLLPATPGGVVQWSRGKRVDLRASLQTAAQA